MPATIPLSSEEKQAVTVPKSNLDKLLDETSETGFQFVIENLYTQLNPVQLGEYLHALVMRGKYSEVITLFNRRPGINVNYADIHGNTALHFALSPASLDLMQVDLLCEKGGELGKTINAKKTSPLQSCFNLSGDAVQALKYLLEKWDSKLAADDIQDVFAEAMRRHWDDFGFYLMERYAGKLNVHQVLNQLTGNRAIHQVMQSSKLDLCLMTSLIRDGATLQDTNAANKTPLDLLLDAKAYDKVVCVMRNFSESVTRAQLAKVFAQLIQEQRYDIYAELLVMHASERPRADKDFLVGALSDAARHLNLGVIVSVVKSLSQQGDLSLLKYIALAAGADLKTKKLAVDGIVRGMQVQEHSALELIAFVQKLEAETESLTYPNLGFYRDRDSASLFGHTWHGKAASGTWARLMEDTQRKVVQLSKGPHFGEKNPVIEAFLSQRTQERHFSIFTRHPERRFLERYSQNFAPAAPVVKVSALFP
jgi:ankyrin repeat protein